MPKQYLCVQVSCDTSFLNDARGGYCFTPGDIQSRHEVGGWILVTVDQGIAYMERDVEPEPLMKDRVVDVLQSSGVGASQHPSDRGADSWHQYRSKIADALIKEFGL